MAWFRRVESVKKDVGIMLAGGSLLRRGIIMSQTNKHTSDKELLWEKIKGIGVAMLTTMEADGTLHSRPMVAPEREFDGDLWFLTMEAAPKVGEVQLHRQVAVSYIKPDKDLFVSVSGTGELVHDQAAVKKLWKSSYHPWLPVGPDDPSLAVLKVHVQSAEYWEESSKNRGMLSFLSKGPKIGQDVKLDMH
jgi:general stress protein 26